MKENSVRLNAFKLVLIGLSWYERVLFTALIELVRDKQ